MDPIDRPDFNPAKAREPDPDTMMYLNDLGKRHKAQVRELSEVRQWLTKAVREAKESGHSYSQIMDATGLSLGTIQRMIK